MTKPNRTPEAEFLRKVEVRLLAPEERERFDELLEQEHYLGSARVGGQSLRYVAEVHGHCEIHKWKDARTYPPIDPTKELLLNVSQPNSKDVYWLQDHITRVY